MPSRKKAILLCLIPFILSLLFAACMFFLANFAADHARVIYQNKIKREALKKTLEYHGAGGNVENKKTRKETYGTYGILMLAVIISFYSGTLFFSKKNKFLTEKIEEKLITISFPIGVLSFSAFLLYIGMLRAGIIQ